MKWYLTKIGAVQAWGIVSNTGELLTVDGLGGRDRTIWANREDAVSHLKRLGIVINVSDNSLEMEREVG